MRMVLIPALMLVLFCLFPGLALATDSGAEGHPSSMFVPMTDAPGDSSLTTQFAQNNNFAGNSFDVTSYIDVTVVGWDCNIGPDAPSYTVHVWWRVGTANGFETTAAGWTELGNVVVVGAGVDQPTHIDVGGLVIPAGTTNGIIITADEAVSGTGGFYYTNGGPNTYDNGQIEIVTFRGLAAGWPPPSVFTYRSWNGTVHYDIDTPLDRTTWGDIKSLDIY